MTKKHLFIIGYKGVDKLAVGQELSRRVGLPLVDFSQQLETSSLTTQEEKANQETQWLTQQVLGQPSVVITSEEIVIRTENRKLMRHNGYVVFVTAGPEEISQALEGEKLPLSLVENTPEQVEEMLLRWEPFYKQTASWEYSLSRQTPQEIATLVANQLPAGFIQPADSSGGEEEPTEESKDHLLYPALSPPEEEMDSEQPVAPWWRQALHFAKDNSKILIAAFTVMLIVGVVYAGYRGVLNQTLGRMQYEPSDEEVVLPSDFIEQDGTINVLLIGTDESSEEFSELARADTIMIASANLDTGEARLISLERGIGVPIPGVGEDWLTHVFAYGGPDLMVQTVRREFDLDISHYARVNFRAFEKIIDILGGVTIDLSEEEAAALQRFAQADLHPGPNHLNGPDALHYARLRSIDSDFQRIERQRNVIQQMVYELENVSLTELYQLAREVLPLVQTNIPPEEISALVKYIPRFIGVDIQQMTIPQEEDVLPGKVLEDGRILTQINFEASARKIHKFIYGHDDGVTLRHEDSKTADTEEPTFYQDAPASPGFDEGATLGVSYG